MIRMGKSIRHKWVNNLKAANNKGADQPAVPLLFARAKRELFRVEARSVQVSHKVF